jgi:integrase/recombinase XerC
MHSTTSNWPAEVSGVTRFVTSRARMLPGAPGASSSSASREGGQPQEDGLVLRRAAAEALDVEPAELVSRWLAGLSSSARRAYGRSLARFARWAIVDAGEPVDALRLLVNLDAARAGELVRRWRDEDLASAGLASGSVAGYIVAIGSLVAAARRAGLVTWRLEGVLPKVEPTQDRSGPRRGDVERLVETIDDAAAGGDAFACRDAAVVRLCYAAALRRSEVVGLRLEDFEPATDLGPVVRPRRKGYKERSAVLVPQRTAEAIEAWLAVRGREPGPLFVRLKGRRPDSGALNGESVRRLLAAWAKRAGLRGRVRPHGLRHSSATTCAKRGSLAELLALGGWKSMSAARRYLDAHNEDRAAALRYVDV